MGEATSDSFDLYLGPGFDAPGLDASIGSGNSSAFPLYLLAPYWQASAGAVGFGDSPAFDAYLDPPFRPEGAAAIAFGDASALDLYLPRLSEGSASSATFAFEPTGAAPGIPFPPIHVEAITSGCTGNVSVSWLPTTSGVSGYEVWRGYRPYFGGGAPQYVYLTTLGGQFTTFPDRPVGSSRYYYRIRAVRGGQLSPFSTAAEVVISDPSPQTPIDFDARNGGEPMYGPPANQVSIAVSLKLTRPAGVTLEIQQSSSSDFSGATTHTREPLSLGGLLYSDIHRYTLQGTAGTTYWLRARTRSACGAASAWTDGQSVVPGRLPVVLLHGIWGSHSEWSAGFKSALTSRGFELDTSFHPTDVGGRFTDWGVQLEGHLRNLLSESGPFHGHEKVDIIAHSQGGLAARSCIEQGEGKDLVRTLVMIGTPNHGGRFAATSSFLRNFCLPGEDETCVANKRFSPGVLLLKTNADELLKLNFKDGVTHDEMTDDQPLEEVVGRKGNVVYYTIAGSGPSAISCARFPLLFCRRNRAKKLADLGSDAGDGVVPWRSVRLRALADEFNWVDFQIPGAGGLAHNLGLSMPGLSTGEPQSAAVAQFAADRFDRLPLPSQAPLATGLTNRATSSRLDAQSDPQLVATVRDSVASGASWSQTVPVDSCSTLTLFVEWADTPQTMRVRAPDGSVLVAADTSTFVGLSFETSDSPAYTAFGVEGPTAGTWTIEVLHSGVSENSVFEADWVVEGGKLEAIGRESEVRSPPGSEVVLGGELRSDGQPIPSVGRATITGSGGGVWEVPLFDDGTHGDSLAGDARLAGVFLVPAGDEAFRAAIEFRGAPFDSTGPRRTAEGAILATTSPDLSLDSSAVAASPIPGQVGQSMTLVARVFNSGSAPADSAVVAITNRTLDVPIGATTISLAPGDTADVVFHWTPLEAGDQRLGLRASLQGGEADLAGSDNLLDFMVPVLPGPATTDVMAALQTPFEFGAPYPNPFDSHLHFEFALPRPGRARLDVFDIAGRLIATLVDRDLPAGRHHQEWNGNPRSGRVLPAGVYLARLRTPAHTAVRKVVRIR